MYLEYLELLNIISITIVLISVSYYIDIALIRIFSIITEIFLIQQ